MPVTPQPIGRFFLRQALPLGPAALADAEAHHLLHVLRAQVGDTVNLFNGDGEEAVAEIVRVRKRSADLNIVQSRTAPDEQQTLTLAVAIPKGDRAKWLVEKLTELGVSRLVPLRTERSIVEPRESKLDKLEQTVIAACKQSGRSRLLQLSPLTDLSTLLKSLSLRGDMAYMAHPSASANLRDGINSQPAAQSTLVLIGPEGGFTELEVAAAESAGIRPVSFGPLVLRVETAALLATAAWRFGMKSPDSSANS